MDLDEQFDSNKQSNLTKTFDIFVKDANKATSDSSSSDDNFVAVKDPVVYSKRGTPKKKKIKKLHEFASTNKSKQSLE
ncbi:13544_t:CDS:2, partial [Racocetra fulgida]